MNRANIYQNNIMTQDARMAKVEKGISLTKLLHSLIREHAAYKHGTYALDIDQLPLSDKRLLLSHFESAEWYEWACQSSMHTETLFSESKNYIQQLIDDNCHEVYMEAMEEMRAYK